jgi:NADH-quinone oxidoreductase subunit C
MTEENFEAAIEPAIGQTQPHQVGVREGAFRSNGSGDTSGFGGLVSPVFLPGATSRPFGSWFDAAADTLEKALAKQGVKANKAIEHYTVDRGEFTIVVRPVHLISVAQTLRDHQELRFEVCVSVSGVHWPADAGRELRANIQLLSMTHNRRLRIEVPMPDTNPHLPSLTPIWPSTDWHERETYDFFGIVFDGHPALTRIQMPDDWPGHPQRKDYPLGGIPVEYKGATVPAPSERRSY